MCTSWVASRWEGCSPNVLLEHDGTRNPLRSGAGLLVGADLVGGMSMQQGALPLRGMSAGVRLENITISYNRHPAVHHVSGTFAPGSLTAIAGPNGAGKSTLLKAVAGLIIPDEGRIIIDGARRSQMAYLPQAATIQRDFPITALHLVTTGFWQQTKGVLAINKEMKQSALSALAEVGLKGMEHRDIGSLSTGQFQRLLFARLLVQNASLILLDEPFAAVDDDTTKHLLALIQQWHKEGRTVLCVLHDLLQIRAYFPECLLLASECIAWSDSRSVLQPDILARCHALHNHWQAQAALCERTQ